MLDGQLDLFSTMLSDEMPATSKSNNVETRSYAEVIKKSLRTENAKDDVTLFKEKQKLSELRRSPSIQKGDYVKVGKPIDDLPESESYIASYKGKKGIVFDMKEVKNPTHNRYLYNVWVLFNEKTKEIGIFYDLELKKIED